MKPLMTPHDVAIEYGISINTIHEWCRDSLNGFPAFKRGRDYKIHRALLNDWFVKQATERRTV